jgi:hypothetical protein
MTSFLRPALFLACCGALAAACWAGVRALDVPLAALAGGRVQGERYDRANAAAQARHRLKLELADGLAGGRLPLAEAIARCRRHLDEEAPADASEAPWYGRGVLLKVEGGCEEERCGRNLIRQVEVKLRASPSVAREVLARLEKELQEHLAGKGPRSVRPRPVSGAPRG